MKNILVTGANGQLGSEIREISQSYPDYLFFFTSKEELDVCEKKVVSAFIIKNNIDIIINCAAYTAVDKAESEHELADRINHLAVKYLAETAKENQVSLIHISTDYVFNGEGFKPYPEDYPKKPVNMYGKTKLAGEDAIFNVNPANSMVIRTSWVYSSFGNNFVKTMLRLGEERKELNVIADQVGAPTYARDLAEFILSTAVGNKSDKITVYHFSNEGVCSWYDFSKEIMILGNKKCKINPISTSQYPTSAKRPFYSLMDTTKLTQDFEYSIPYWKDSLKECIGILKK